MLRIKQACVLWVLGQVEPSTKPPLQDSWAQDLSEMKQDQVLRDGSFTEAKEALSKLDVSWRHSQLQQNVLFFISARQPHGSEILGRRTVQMGINLAEVDATSKHHSSTQRLMEI